ncbi:hypothetical protein FA95DRAFT_1605331 [Auriscalpium vulgare]|uniref:Uncharacterized protein n=1 Tax=Auriscalpium vulgare TaxID=40419 RepID=A0ACB8RXT1_9AGAM|nr:hypothetical protein FA95DRAFT_1605331 [Auriscalpium vulgare]
MFALGPSDPAPASVQSNASTRLVFTDSSGVALKVFVDNSSIHNRTKLIRLLRKQGAEIIHHVNEAKILVVNTEAVSGKRFVRDWEAHKPVVEYPWVQACIDRGTAILEEDQWGGFLAVDDGASIHSDDVDEEDGIHIPPPPPRAVPARSAPGPSSQPARPAMSVQMPRSEVPALAVWDQMLPSAGTQPTTNGQQPSVANGQHAPAVNGHQPPDHLFQNPFSPTTFASQNTLNGGLNGLYSPQMQYPMHNAYMPHGLAAYSPALFPQSPLTSMPFPRLLETVIAVGRNQNYDVAPIQAYLSAIQLPAVPPVGLPLHQVPDTDDDASRPASSSSRRHSSTSLKRKASDMDNEAPSGSQRRVRPDSSSESHSRASGSKSTSKAPTSRRTGSSPPTKGVFTAQGRPIPIYVQVDLYGKQRGEVVQAIRKAGGTITADIGSARYVVLNARSASYPELKRHAETASRPMVQASFVYDCIDENSLLDPEDYAVEEPSLPVKPRASRSFLDNRREPALVPLPPSPFSQPSGRRRSRSPDPPTPPSSDGRGYLPEEKEFVWKYYRYLLQDDPYLTRNKFSKLLQAKIPRHTDKNWYQHLTYHKDRMETVRAEVLPSISGAATHSLLANGDTNGDAQDEETPEHEHEQEHGPTGRSSKRQRTQEDAQEEVQRDEHRQEPSGHDENLAEEEDVEAKLNASEPPGEPLAETHDTQTDEDRAYHEDFARIVEFLAGDDADDGGEELIWSRMPTYVDWPAFLDNHLDAVTKALSLVINEKRGGDAAVPANQ